MRLEVMAISIKKMSKWLEENNISDDTRLHFIELDKSDNSILLTDGKDKVHVFGKWEWQYDQKD